MPYRHTAPDTRENPSAPPSGDKPTPTNPYPEKPSTPPRPLVFFIGNSITYVPYYLAVAAQIDSEVLYYQTWHATAGSNSVIEYQVSVNELNNESPPIGIAIAPAGLVWNKIYATDSSLKFDPDDVHQDERGASINAAVFYYTLFPKAPKLDGILLVNGLEHRDSP